MINNSIQTQFYEGIEVQQIVPQVFFLSFDNQEELTRTFLRFQEYYESPRFRGEVFSLEEYREWYTRENGEWSYYTDWGGFNIPSYVFDPFFAGEFQNLSERELRLMRFFQARHQRGEKFYVIATFKRERSNEAEKGLLYTLKHEVAHALFYMNSDYHAEVSHLLDQYADITGPIENFLRSSAGYHEEVIRDEVHAYLITRPEESFAHFRLEYEPYIELATQLENVFERYFYSVIEE